jgi:hypothetical protein
VVVEERTGIGRLHDRWTVELLELEVSERRRQVVCVSKRTEHREDLPEAAIARQVEVPRQRDLVRVRRAGDVESLRAAVEAWKPGVVGLNVMAAVPPPLKWHALRFLWPGSNRFPLSRNSVFSWLARGLFSTRVGRSKSS